jgi:VWFA-related protein
MVHTLNPANFELTDNGVPQQITHFDLGTDPLSVVFAIETSSRIASFLPAIHKTGILFTETVLGPNGEGAVLVFDDSVEKLQDFTDSHDDIENSVKNVKAEGSAVRLYDAMAAGIEMLSSRPQVAEERGGRRRVLLVLSEAADIGSDARLGEVLRAAQLANVTIYSVGMSLTKDELKGSEPHQAHRGTPQGISEGPAMPGSLSTEDAEAARLGEGNGNLLALVPWVVEHVKAKFTAHALELAALGTGGDRLAASRSHSMEKAIDEVGGELHSQYVLSYAPTGTDALGYHEIKVTVSNSRLKVRARPGYFVAAAEN